MDQTEMMDSQQNGPSKSGLEADIAYFGARISMLKETPLTSYQRAQFQAYSTLESALIGTLMRMETQQAVADRRKQAAKEKNN
jgi:hypothetical protein